MKNKIIAALAAITLAAGSAAAQLEPTPSYCQNNYVASETQAIIALGFMTGNVSLCLTLGSRDSSLAEQYCAVADQEIETFLNETHPCVNAYLAERDASPYYDPLLDTTRLPFLQASFDYVSLAKVYMDNR